MKIILFLLLTQINEKFIFFRSYQNFSQTNNITINNNEFVILLNIKIIAAVALKTILNLSDSTKQIEVQYQEINSSYHLVLDGEITYLSTLPLMILQTTQDDIKTETKTIEKWAVIFYYQKDISGLIPGVGFQIQNPRVETTFDSSGVLNPPIIVQIYTNDGQYNSFIEQYRYYEGPFSDIDFLINDIEHLQALYSFTYYNKNNQNMWFNMTDNVYYSDIRITNFQKGFNQETTIDKFNIVMGGIYFPKMYLSIFQPQLFFSIIYTIVIEPMNFNSNLIITNYQRYFYQANKIYESQANFHFENYGTFNIKYNDIIQNSGGYISNEIYNQPATIEHIMTIYYFCYIQNKPINGELTSNINNYVKIDDSLDNSVKNNSLENFNGVASYHDQHFTRINTNETVEWVHYVSIYLEEILFYNFNASNSDISDQLLNNVEQNLFGRDQNVIGRKKNSILYRHQPDNMKTLNFNIHSQTFVNWKNRNQNLCSISNCTFCDSGVCIICNQNYYFSSGQCIYCEYPKLIINNSCELSDLNVTLTYPANTLTNFIQNNIQPVINDGDNVYTRIIFSIQNALVGVQQKFFNKIIKTNDDITFLQNIDDTSKIIQIDISIKEESNIIASDFNISSDQICDSSKFYQYLDNQQVDCISSCTNQQQINQSCVTQINGCTLYQSYFCKSCDLNQYNTYGVNNFICNPISTEITTTSNINVQNNNLSNQVTILNCLIEDILQNICIMCKQQYNLINNTCLSKPCNELIKQCQTCDINSITCLTCNDKYILQNNKCNVEFCQELQINDNTKCQTCQNSYYIQPDKTCSINFCDPPNYINNSICLLCEIQNCSQCIYQQRLPIENLQQDCQICEINYTLVNKEYYIGCVPDNLITDNCIKYNSNNQCIECGLNYFLFDNNQCNTKIQDYLCVQNYCVDQFCQSCIDDSTFIQNGCIINYCIEYQIPSGICINCQQIQNCFTYQQTGQCQTCNGGYILFNNICYIEVQNCQTYDQQTGQCSSCLQNFLLNQNQCQQNNIYIYGCIEQDQDICLECDKKLILISNNCFLEVKFCELYNSIGNCLKCIVDFQFIDLFCVKKIQDCIYFDYQTGNCLDCLSSEYYTEKCQQIQQYDFKQDIRKDLCLYEVSNCIDCDKFNYELCKQCSPQYYLQNNKCIQILNCDIGCKICQQNKCIECLKNNNLIDGNCFVQYQLKQKIQQYQKNQCEGDVICYQDKKLINSNCEICKKMCLYLKTKYLSKINYKFKNINFEEQMIIEDDVQITTNKNRIQFLFGSSYPSILRFNLKILKIKKTINCQPDFKKTYEIENQNQQNIQNYLINAQEIIQSIAILPNLFSFHEIMRYLLQLQMTYKLFLYTKLQNYELSNLIFKLYKYIDKIIDERIIREKKYYEILFLSHSNQIFEFQLLSFTEMNFFVILFIQIIFILFRKIFLQRNKIKKFEYVTQQLYYDLIKQYIYQQFKEFILNYGFYIFYIYLENVVSLLKGFKLCKTYIKYIFILKIFFIQTLLVIFIKMFNKQIKILKINFKEKQFIMFQKQFNSISFMFLSMIIYNLNQNFSISIISIIFIIQMIIAIYFKKKICQKKWKIYFILNFLYSMIHFGFFINQLLINLFPNLFLKFMIQTILYFGCFLFKIIEVTYLQIIWFKYQRDLKNRFIENISIIKKSLNNEKFKMLNIEKMSDLKDYLKNKI